jgi:hypothetical protein
MKNLLIVMLTILFCLNGSLVAQKPMVPQNGKEKSTGGKHKNDSQELILMKSFKKGETLESTKKVSVSGEYTMLKLMVHGGVKSGKIIITLIKPNNENLKCVEIDATSDVTFEQAFDLTEHTDLIGDWQIKIQAENAEGSYHLVINTRDRD